MPLTTGFVVNYCTKKQLPMMLEVKHKGSLLHKNRTAKKSKTAEARQAPRVTKQSQPDAEGGQSQGMGAQ